MVVSTQHVDIQIVAAVELIGHVGNVTCNISCIAIGLNHHAILGVAIIGGLEPPSIVSLVHMAFSLELFQRGIDCTRFKEGVFVEVDIKIHAKLVQGLLDLRKHHLHAVCAESFLNLFLAAL